jgi:choline kinase
VLLDLDGETLLERNVRQIQAGFPRIERITIVVGFQEAEVRAVGGPDLHYVVNPDYAESNTAHSLALALEERPDDTLLMNGDVLCDQVAVIQSCPLISGAVCEFKEVVDPEEVQVRLDPAGSVVNIGKDIGGVAEAVGIYRFSADWATQYLRTYAPDFKNRYYEDVFNRMLSHDPVEPFAAVDLGGGYAVEIDTPADLERAKAHLQFVAKAA